MITKTFSLRRLLLCATLGLTAFAPTSRLAAQEGPGGRPEPPQFIEPTYIERPSWMRYEQKADEPIENVQARVARFAGQTFDIDTLRWSGPGAIDIVVMGDGYTAAEQAKFTADARRCTDHLFETTPFDRYKDFFNIFALHVVSEESGISHPGQWKETDGVGEMVCPEGKTLPIVRKRTFFGAHLDGWGVHRITGAWNSQSAKDLVRMYFPRCKFPCILCNTDEYGGAGGEILMATCNSAASEIYVHELAHVFGDLADEYFGGDVYMGEKPNLSSVRDSARVRWHRWIGEAEVGVFPHRGGRKGAYYVKPTQASDTSRYCKMERLGKEFCPVCRERLVEAIHEQADLIAAASPADSVLAPLAKRERVTFSLDHVRRVTGDKQTVRWFVDGTLAAEDTEALTLDAKRLPAESAHEVRLEVYDESPFVRNPTCPRYHTSVRTWRIARRR
ncbi:MAG: hypothetical protein J6M53_01605 [Bacteroidaceae bacterium]|nr:hypothetical protein [Bacteroidaceae bacterium]